MGHVRRLNPYRRPPPHRAGTPPSRCCSPRRGRPSHPTDRSSVTSRPTGCTAVAPTAGPTATGTAQRAISADAHRAHADERSSAPYPPSSPGGPDRVRVGDVSRRGWDGTRRAPAVRRSTDRRIRRRGPRTRRHIDVDESGARSSDDALDHRVERHDAEARTRRRRDDRDRAAADSPSPSRSAFGALARIVANATARSAPITGRFACAATTAAGNPRACPPGTRCHLREPEVVRSDGEADELVRWSRPESCAETTVHGRAHASAQGDVHLSGVARELRGVAVRTEEARVEVVAAADARGIRVAQRRVRDLAGRGWSGLAAGGGVRGERADDRRRGDEHRCAGERHETSGSRQRCHARRVVP